MKTASNPQYPELKVALEDQAPASGAMSVEEFCRWACIGKTKLYAEAKAGRLVLRKMGAKTLILRIDAEVWLRSLPTSVMGDEP